MWSWVETGTAPQTSHWTGQERSRTLARLEAELTVVDVWRVKHPHARQYTWVKVVDGLIFAARLDRFYMSHCFSNRLLSSHIYPVGFTDHHSPLISMSPLSSMFNRQPKAALTGTLM